MESCYAVSYFLVSLMKFVRWKARVMSLSSVLELPLMNRMRMGKRLLEIITAAVMSVQGDLGWRKGGKR